MADDRKPLLSSHEVYYESNSQRSSRMHSSKEESYGKYREGRVDFNRMKRASIGSLMMLPPVTLSWENINVYVPADTKKKKKSKLPKLWDAERGASAGHESLKHIVKNVSGVVKPGTLIAVMGASGAGKSTLMNVLTNRNLKDYVVEGSVKVNGVSLGKGIRDISAYVQQDDLFYGTLTVREALVFRAMLRMDQSITAEARMQRVQDVLVEMSLSKCADTQIGIPGAKKGISGGESKRLSFACEMLTNPPLIFCDEPTSGLDTFMAQNIVSTLKTMAKKKRTILCTIHQPSSETFALFDQILLVAEGRFAFMGACSKALEFFSSLNHICPRNYNPSDFFILTLAIAPGKEAECRSKVKAICDAFLETDEAKEMNREITEISVNEGKNVSLMEEIFSSESRYEASWIQQFRFLLWRSWISLMRNVNLFRVRVVQTIVVSLMLGLVFLQLDYNQKGVMNINGAMFLLITNQSFFNMFAVVNSFPSEVPIFLREYGSGLYRTDVYYLGKVLAELPTFLMLPFLCTTITYWMMGLRDDAETFFVFAAILILISNVSSSYGLIISTVSPDVNVAVALSVPLMIPVMLFGGFFLNSDDVPDYFVWLEAISWFKYATEYLMVNQWKGYGNITCETSSVNETIPCQFKTGKDVIKYYSFDEDDKSLDLAMMFVLLGTFYLLAYVLLFIRARRSKV